MQEAVMVIGGGLAGMKASLLLAEAGIRVHLVERTSILGGRMIRSEDVYPAMECATCMLSPMQQEVLGGGLITIHLLSNVISVQGSEGNFSIRVASLAPGIDQDACIGCGECWNSCPVSVPNEFEEYRADRCAISIPCAGALPNVPWIDRDSCLRYTSGNDCTLCADACVFGAVTFDDRMLETELDISHIVLATGDEPTPPPWVGPIPQINRPRIFTAPEFERLYASNGPTGGELVCGDGLVPHSAVILASPFNMLPSEQSAAYSRKFVHYLSEKLQEPVITIVSDSTLKVTDATVSIADSSPEVTGGGPGEDIHVTFLENGHLVDITADILITACGSVPSRGTSEMTEILGLDTDDEGWPVTPDSMSTVLTSRPGICIAGSAKGAIGASTTVISAMAAAGRIISGRAGSG